MELTRRSLFLGALAIPVGASLPKAIAAELSLPPPIIKTGDQIQLPRLHQVSVLDLDGFYEGNGEVLVVKGTNVVGCFRIAGVSMGMNYGSVGVKNLDARMVLVHRYARYSGRRDLELQLVEIS